MEPVLYLDVLFCVNWMMDAVVLLLTGRILKRRIRPGAVAAAAAAGSLWVCLCAALACPGWLVRLAGLGPVAVGMAALCYPVRRELLRLVICLYVSAAFLGGLMHIVYDNSSLGRFWRLWMAGREAGAVSVWLLALSMAGSLLAAECILRYREGSRNREYIQDVILTYRGRQLTVAALWDSGNRLVSPFTGQAVHILELAACRDFLGEETCRYLENMAQGKIGETGGNGIPRACLVPCRSVGNAHGLLPVMTLEGLSGAGGFREEAPAVGFCLNPLSKEESYRMLLHSQADRKRRNPNDH